MTEARQPCDLHLERDAIASCLARPETILTVGLSEDSFALEGHRKVWRAMCDLLELGEHVDLVRVRSRLIDSDDLGSIGGESFLTGLRTVAPSKSLPLDRLHRMAKLRALRAAAETVANAAAGNDPDMASAALDGAQALAADGARVKTPKTARELGEEWYASLSRDPNEGTVSPGLPALKRVIGRLDEGSMTLIGADVNVGKSTLALEMMLLALLDGEKVGYLSFEDPEKIVTQRIMSVLGGVSPKVIRRFRPGDPNGTAIDRALKVMHALDDKMQVSNCIGMNEREALEQMAMMVKRGARLIVLDYIGVVGCSVKQQDRQNEIRWIATRFKARATYAKTALVVVSQFHRLKEGEEPGKHAYKDSGALEAMAEYAVNMWRKVEDDFSPVYCKLVKSKTGGNGYAWTMQRETEALDESGNVIPNVPGSGRLVEVAHGDETIFDDDGKRVWVRPVMRDRTGNERWRVEESSR